MTGQEVLERKWIMEGQIGMALRREKEAFEAATGYRVIGFSVQMFVQETPEGSVEWLVEDSVRCTIMGPNKREGE